MSDAIASPTFILIGTGYFSTKEAFDCLTSGGRRTTLGVVVNMRNTKSWRSLTECFARGYSAASAPLSGIILTAELRKSVYNKEVLCEQEVGNWVP